jgi:hypothetical protein
MSADDDVTAALRAAVDDYLREPLKPAPNCPACTGTGWITQPGSGEGWVAISVCNCRLPREAA